MTTSLSGAAPKLKASGLAGSPHLVTASRLNSKNRDIEILRAFAISTVMLSHWAPHALARVHGVGALVEGYTGLWSGVDLFFCVSGYVITLSLLHQTPAPGRFSIFAIPFWIRRVFRLWPSAWFWAAIAVVFSYTFNATGLFGKPANTVYDAWMAVANLANFHEFSCLRDHSCGALRIYWSLSLEEQFYWIFPFVVFFCRRRVLIGLLVLATCSQLFLERPMAFMTESPSLLWLTRTDAICLGALTALLTRTPLYAYVGATLSRHRSKTLWLAIALMIVLATAAGPRFQLSLATGLLAVVSVLLVWLASYNSLFIFPRVPALEPLLIWLGARSYSLYLVHDMGNTIAAEIRMRVSLPIGGFAWAAYSLILTIGLTLTLAEFSYRAIESPFRRYGRRMAERESQRLRLSGSLAGTMEG